MKKNTFLTTALIVSYFANGQVLLSEDFNSYPAGHLNTDYTGTTPGQGGWLTQRHANVNAIAMITPETGKGNVVTFTTNNTLSYEAIKVYKNIIGLWNNRTAGNNVLKFEYEVYGTGFFNTEGTVEYNNFNFMTLCFKATSAHRIEARTSGSGVTNQTLKSYTSSTFPYNTWHKVELFFDYNTKKAYYYIPSLNLFKVDNIVSTITNLPNNISISADSFKSGTIVKYDNIKLTALPSVPAYILGANEMVSAKFNIYPNPATNVVNISNNENILVAQVTIYDMAGKQLNTQNFNNENNIQLNIENLASGTYMLHLQTNIGLVFKKLIKK